MKSASQVVTVRLTSGCSYRKPVKHIVSIQEPTQTSTPLREISPVRRAIFVSLGVLFVGIAAVGVFLPGIPTVGPLILASIFLTKSSPALERKLIRRNKFFAKYLPYLDGTTEMPPKAKLTSILLMWLSITFSCTLLYLTSEAPAWLLATIVVAGVIGTVFIQNYGKKKSK